MLIYHEVDGMNKYIFRRTKKIITLCMGVVLMLSLIPLGVSAVDYQEYRADGQIERVIVHEADGSAYLDTVLTRGQMASLIVYAFDMTQVGSLELFSDIDESEQYYREIAIAVGEGVFLGDCNGRMRPNDPITRQEAAVALCKVLNLTRNDAWNDSFADADEIALWARDSVGALVRAGVMNAYEDNTFRPQAEMRYGEMRSILYNLSEGKAAGEESGSTIPVQLVQDTTLMDGNSVGCEEEIAVIYGNVIIAGAGVALKNVHITGNIIIEGGRRTGEIQFLGVVVEGAVIVANGKGDTITIDNTTLQKTWLNEIIVRNADTILNVQRGAVAKTTFEDAGRIHIGGKCEVATVVIDTDKEVLVAGKAPDILIMSEANISLSGAKVEILTIAEEAEGSSVRVAPQSFVALAEVHAASVFDGQGTIDVMDARVLGVQTNIQPRKNIGEEITVVEMGFESKTPSIISALETVEFDEAENQFKVFLRLNFVPSGLNEHNFVVRVSGKPELTDLVLQVERVGGGIICLYIDAAEFGAIETITIEALANPKGLVEDILFQKI